MSDGGISLGGPGGLTPGESKISKSLSELSKPQESDVLKFQTALEGQGQQASAPSTPTTTTSPEAGPKMTAKIEDSGPFTFRFNTITDQKLIDQKPNLGKVLINYAKDISTVASNQSENISKKMKEVSTKGFSQADAMEFQVMMFEMTNLTEVISKGVGKVVQGLQGVVKNQ